VGQMPPAAKDKKGADPKAAKGGKDPKVPLPAFP
jgi:hypothetical protein